MQGENKSMSQCIKHEQSANANEIKYAPISQHPAELARAGGRGPQIKAGSGCIMDAIEPRIPAAAVVAAIVAVAA